MNSEQLSFIGDSGLLDPDSICRSDTFCAFCGASLAPRKRVKKLYWLAGRPPRRLCSACYTLYVKSFVERIVVVKRGAKK